MTVRRRRWLGAFFFALMFGHFSVNAYLAWLDLIMRPTSSDGWTARLAPDGRAKIVSVDEDGPATALQVGDEFISINGLTLRDNPEILSYNQRVAPGTRYTIVVRRQGQVFEFTLTTIGYPISRWFMPIADTFVQLLFLLTGLTVFLLKPADQQAWLLALMLGAFTGLFNSDLPPLPTELTQSLRTVTGLPQLLELVATKIQTALQTVNVTIFLRDQTTGNYNSAYSRDYSETDGRVISRERHSLLPHYAGIMKQPSDNGEPLDVEQYVAAAQPVEMRLQPGDALIWLSDGFEERMNHANQFWGSEQVEQTLKRICGQESSAENIARRMIEACDGAAGGRSND